jgi:hypothetical protein
MRDMKPMAALLAVLLAVLEVALLSCSALADDQPCTAGGRVYDPGKMVCMRGFVQRCENGSWSNQQRFCSDDTQFEVIGEPEVAVPQPGGENQPGVPAADAPSQVEVPPVQ